MNEPNDPKTITGHIMFDVVIIIIVLLFIFNMVAVYLENKNKTNK